MMMEYCQMFAVDVCQHMSGNTLKSLGCNILMQSIKVSDPVLDMSWPKNIQLGRSLMAERTICNKKSTHLVLRFEIAFDLLPPDTVA